MSRANSPGISDASKNSSDVPPSRLVVWCSGLIIALAFILAAALSWRKWPDLAIDFGLQLYLPWKISTGSVLYRDVMYLTAGPLSQYYHALLFKCFGVSFRTLIFSNLALTAGMLFLLHRRFRAAANIWTATIICLAIILVFAFNQYGDIGNYNYIAPYCHEIVHGVFLSILTVMFLSDWLTRKRMSYAITAGVCTGLVFLTKPEVFLALSVTVVAAFGLFAITNRRRSTYAPLASTSGESRGAGESRANAGGNFLIISSASFLLAAASPLLAFTFCFHRSEDWHTSLRSTGFAWVPVVHGGVSGGTYYRWCLGLDTPGFHMFELLKQFVIIAVIVTAFAFLFRRKMDSSANRLLAIGAVGAVLAAASRFDWVNCGYTLALLDLIFVALLCVNHRNLPRERTPVFLLLWGIFGFFLTAKLGLFCRIWHYGFILAMPACATTICLLLWLLPKLLQKFSVHAGRFRLAIGLVILLGCARLFVQSQFTYRDKTIAVGEDGDKIFASVSKLDPVGASLQIALPWLEKNLPPDASLAVLPEGAMVNYLSRRTNPTRYLVWNPVEFAMFGQENMSVAFRQAAPDYIMLIHRDAAEYGAKYFGQQPEFGLELMQWIQQNYETVQLIGHEPLQSSLFGIKILRRRSAKM